MFIKNLVEKIKARFEDCGGETTRETFSGELNYEAGKVFYLVILSLVIWLPYIRHDLKMHPFPALVVTARILLSILSACMIALRFTKRFKCRPDILEMVVIVYLSMSTALITATSGGFSAAYVGGYIFIIGIPIACPFSSKFKLSVTLLSITVYFLTGTLTGMDFSNPSMQYYFFDLFAAILFYLIFTFTLTDLRYRSWEQRQKLKKANELNEKNLTTIFNLANKADKSARSKSDFLAKMSHEIRTPMNAILGMAELALREDMPNSARENIFTIKQSGANLLSIINDILDFSKIESGKLEIVNSEYFFSSLINDVISIIRMKIVDSQVKFVVSIDCNVPNALLGDETRIRQILLNILSNAVKYTEKGYVALSIIGEISGENTVILTIDVTDSGIGIKREDIEKLFGDFVQLDSGRHKGIEGTGLGLAITWNLLKAMGGDISISSEYGRGTTFTVTLPQKIRGSEKLASVENFGEKSVLVYELREIYADSIACTVDNLGARCTLVSTDSELYEKMAGGMYSFVFIASNLYKNAREMCSKFESHITIVLLCEPGEFVSDNHLRIIAMPAYSVSVANVLNGISDGFSYRERGESFIRFVAPDAEVLIVDDINTNLSVAEGLLMLYKIRVTPCRSGMEAIEAINARRFDLVLMDHMMPEMNGIEATKRIREQGDENVYYKNVPIVALTANAMSGTKEMFLENGFDDFLSKPIDMVELNAVLEKWIPKEKQNKYAINYESAATVPEYDAAKNIKIEGLDFEKGLFMSGGTVENFRRTLTVFLQDGFEKSRGIKMCLETYNLPLYVTYVHALKSAAANIGARELSEMAEALEVAGNQEDLAFIEKQNVKLISVLELLMNRINAALEADEQGRNEPADMELLKAELIKLAAAIEDLDAAAIKTSVKGIEPFTNSADIGSLVEDILQNMLIGEYDEALSIINYLLREENMFVS